MRVEFLLGQMTGRSQREQLWRLFQQSAGAYLTEKGIKVLAALDEVASAHNAANATIALAWLAAQPTVVAPIASARTTEQLPDLLSVSEVRLSDLEIRRLNEASSFQRSNGNVG